MEPVQLLKIGELARSAGVSIPTVKYYLREGLITAHRKTGRTMAWYDAGLVPRIRAIRELQHDRFLPLAVIRQALDQTAGAGDDVAAAEAIARVLARHQGERSKTRAELLAAGWSVLELDFLASAGLAAPSGPDRVYRGDDLAVLSTLGAARRAGLRPDMLPFAIMTEYLAAMRALVAVELRMFRAGVIARADTPAIGPLTEAATELSERLVVLLRRKLLLPMLDHLRTEDHASPSPPPSPGHAHPVRAPGRRVREHVEPGRKRRAGPKRR